MKLTNESHPTYDVLVWIGAGGAMMVGGYSRIGHASLRALSDEYCEDDSLHINCHPDLFMSHMDPRAKVGILSPDQSEVFTMSKNSLH